jgi:hypothetical protein
LLPARNPRGVADMRADLDVGRQFLQRRQRQRQSGDHAGLPRHEDGLRFGCFRDRRKRGDVASAAEILVEGAVHGLVDRKRGQEGVGIKQ